MANNPISLREGLTDDAKILFETITANQTLIIQRFDTVIELIKNIEWGNGGNNGGGTVDPPIGDLTDLPSTIHEEKQDVLTESGDGVTSTYFTNYAPIIYGSFKLFSNEVQVSVNDFEIQYTTGQVKLLNPAKFLGKKLRAEHNHEIVTLTDKRIGVHSAVPNSYKIPYTNLIKTSVKITNSVASNIAPTNVDKSTGVITVDAAKFTASGDIKATFSVILPLAYSRIVGTTDSGQQVSHTFINNYAALFTAIVDTQGDNGEFASNHASSTSTFINTGQENIDLNYAVIYDSTGRIYVGDSNYNSGVGISVTHNLGTPNFKAFVITNNSATGYIGEVWVDSKSDQTLKVYNSGSDAVTPFKYVTIKDSVGTETGSGRFDPAGTVIQHNLALGTDYSVLIQPTEDPDGYLGDIWVDIQSNKFTVHSSGSAQTSFDYLIIEN